MATAKALTFRGDLASSLAIRLPTLTQALSFGAGNQADMLIGTAGAGNDNAFIRINQFTTAAVDVLGLAQNVFTPHVAQVVFEANPAGGAGADVGTWATRLSILGELIQKGIRVELYFSANTVAVSSAAITGAPSAVYEGHVQYPQMATL